MPKLDEQTVTCQEINFSMLRGKRRGSLGQHCKQKGNWKVFNHTNVHLVCGTHVRLYRESYKVKRV